MHKTSALRAATDERFKSETILNYSRKKARSGFHHSLALCAVVLFHSLHPFAECHLFHSLLIFRCACKQCVHKLVIRDFPLPICLGHFEQSVDLRHMVVKNCNMVVRTATWWSELQRGGLNMVPCRFHSRHAGFTAVVQVSQLSCFTAAAQIGRTAFTSFSEIGSPRFSASTQPASRNLSGFGSSCSEQGGHTAIFRGTQLHPDTREKPRGGTTYN